MAVCPQRPEFLKQMRGKNGLTFDILRDEGIAVQNDWACAIPCRLICRKSICSFPLDLPRINGEPSWTLPMPARYVVNRSGVVIAADYDPDYTIRPEPAKILEDLDRI